MGYCPLVSVILPVYNRPTVVNTIESITSQSYRNLEIIVIDNASNDDTVKRIMQLNDTRIRLIINEKNMGQTYSLNRGLIESTGKYIARIDSDDLAFPDRIYKQVKFLEEHQEYVLVGSWVQFISDDDKIGMIVKMPTTSVGMEVMQTVACGMYHPTAMYRRNIILENSISYDENYHMAEDYDLWVRLMKYGKACNLDEVLVYYRRGSNNDSTIYSKIMGEECEKIRKRVCQNLNCSQTEKNKLFYEIDLEKKERKSIRDCINICIFYKNYLNEKIDRTNEDYTILRQHFLIRIYTACFMSSSVWYATILRKIYIFLKRIKNRSRGIKL